MPRSSGPGRSFGSGGVVGALFGQGGFPSAVQWPLAWSWRIGGRPASVRAGLPSTPSSGRGETRPYRVLAAAVGSSSGSEDAASAVPARLQPAAPFGAAQGLRRLQPAVYSLN